LQARDNDLVDLEEVPLFLSARGTRLRAKGFRDTYWVPACRAIGC
jgi:hypothetical protein